MKEYIDKAMTWIKSNMWLSIGIGLVAILLFFPKLLRGTTRRRRRSYASAPARRRRTRTGSRPTARRRTKRTYSKGGARKKPWQIKGSLAAKRYMAKIRRKR